MNIRDAKLEIGNTLRAYLRKNDRGEYVFPLVRQRPIVLMGPPGIGKTAILEQIAEENDVGLVSYSLTHHTRQSAVGLPHIETVEYEGQKMTVTQYTMSEIVAAVYRYMEKTGKREGILFLDEINCVSETLAPTMLQLLQNKMFGSHPIPTGWVLVAAGNPPEYNKSVREFDIATLDRVRMIPIDADVQVWLAYARNHRVHGAILSYLDIRPEHFYRVEDKAQEKRFVTARGWEDLSQLLLTYEEMAIPVEPEVIYQYLREKEIAEGFAAYYALYQKYRQDYGIPEILNGTLTNYSEKVQMAQAGSFEERFTVTGLVNDALGTEFARYGHLCRYVQALRESLQKLPNQWGPGQLAEAKEKSLQVLQASGIVTHENLENQVIETLKQYDLELKKAHIQDQEPGMEKIRELYKKETDALHTMAGEISASLTRAFQFLEACFGDGQELILFVTNLTKDQNALEFLSQYESKEFLEHRNLFLFLQQEQQLQETCKKIFP